MSLDIAALMDAGGLPGRDAFTLDAAGDGVAVLVDVSDDEALDAWARARAAVEHTGRWPVLCDRADAHDGDDLFSRYFFKEGDGDAHSPAAVLARAQTVDVDSLIAVRRRTANLDGPNAYDIPDDDASVGVMEGWGWGTFGEAGPMTLVLLPAAEAWSVYAYVHTLYDAYGYSHALLVAAARRWHERYGAEPVAAMGGTTWLTVARPPAEPADATRLAREHEALAESTFATPGLSLRRYAEALPSMDRWLLFSRP